MATTESVSNAPSTRLEPGARPRATTFAAVLWAVAGVLFALYPALRPYTSEVGMAGATAFSSDRWVAAHVAGMAAFGCLAAGSCLLASPRFVRVATVLGVGLILPYYGAETFGLHAIGVDAVRHGAADLSNVADTVRYNPLSMLMFGAGWIALALAGAALGRALWVRDVRVGAVAIGAGMVLYLPQFFGPPWVRVAHGVVLGLGLLIASVSVAKGATGD